MRSHGRGFAARGPGELIRLTRQSSLNNHKCPDQVRHDDAVC
jgi:hypothetical protein